MKQKLNKIFYLTIFVSLLFFQSCQKDFDEEISTNQAKYTIKDYSKEEASRIPKFNLANQQAVTKIRQLKNSKYNATLKEEQTNFTIDYSTVREISVSDNYTTYTMAIDRDESDPNYFENLVIEINNGETKEYLMKYTPTEPIVYVPEHDSYNFVGDVEINTYPTCILCNPTEGDNNGGTQGGGTGNGQVWCRTVIMCNYLYVHVAGPNCTRKFPRTICGTNFGNMGNDGPPDEVGPNNGNQHGGSGSSTGNNSGSGAVVTTPVIPPPDEKKCALFNKLKNDNPFKNIIQVLKNGVTQNYEQGVVLSTQPEGDYNAIIGTANPDNEYAVGFDIPNGTFIDIMVHNHYAGGLSIFSPADLEQIYKTLKNPNYKTGINFVSIVVTPDQEVYAITITDKTAFLAYADENFGTESKFYKYSLLYSQNLDDPLLKGFGINKNHTSPENEKNFLKMLGRNSGLKVHKANSDLSQWNPLTLNPNNTVLAEPACN